MKIERMKTERRFPIQQQQDSINGFVRPAGYVPWGIAALAYQRYIARYGQQETMEELAARGGFGWGELVHLLIGEKDKYLEIPACVEDKNVGVPSASTPS